MKNEVKVGVFVFISIIMLFFLTTQVGSFKNYSKKGYKLYANLEDAAGLEKNSKVKANGIDVGYIDSLNIDGNHIKVTLFLDEGVKLPVDSVLSPMQASMLGGKYAAIQLGSQDQYLSQGDIIKTDKGLASIDEASDSMTSAADEFRSFIVDFKKVFDGEARDNLRHTFANLESITAELKAFTKLNKLNETADSFNEMARNLSETGEKFSNTANIINGKLPAIMENLDVLVRDLKIASLSMKSKVPELADKFSKIGDELQLILNENRKPLTDSLNSADAFFATGEDAFAKVDALLETIDKVQLEVAMRSEWMADDKYNKGYLSLDYKPSDTKSYKFDVAGMDDFTNIDDSGKLIEPKLHEESKLLVSAQIAKRFDDTTIRAGLIENTFGAGMDYYMLNDSLKASAEVFDFNAENDVRGDSVHAKVGARYTLLKHLDVFGGADNFLNKDATNLYLGLGVRFYDDDLKTLITSQALLGSLATQK